MYDICSYILLLAAIISIILLAFLIFNRKKEASVKIDDNVKTSTITLPTHNDDKETKKKKIDLLFDLAKMKYSEELERTNALENKANTIIGFISIVISLLIGFGAISIVTKLEKVEYSIPYFIGVGFLLLSIFSSLHVLRIREWNTLNVTGMKKYLRAEYSYLF